MFEAAAFADFPAAVLGLAVAAGGGLLIGLERERRTGRGPRREAAGIRSFTLAALAGGFAQTLGEPLLLVLGGALVATLAAVAYAASRRRPGAGAAASSGPDRGSDGPPSRGDDAGADDPGLTTELALFVTYLVGALAVDAPPLGAGAAAAVALLLAARERLHRFATAALSEAEVHDALLLTALALVALPLLPRGPVPALGGLEPRTLGALVLLILLLQAAGHVAGRLLGLRAGLALSGLFAGFVSSTATIAAMGARFRRAPLAAAAERAACAAGGMFSTASTWLQAGAMLLAVSPPLAARIAPAVLAGAAVAVASAIVAARRHSEAATRSAAADETALAAPAAPRPGPAGGPLRVREALVVAALLAVVTLVVSEAQRRFGAAGALAGAVLGALADAHAAIAALGTLHAKGEAAGGVGARTALAGVLLAIGTNALTRTAVAFVAGGWFYGAALGLSLAASTSAATVTLWLFGGLDAGP